MIKIRIVGGLELECFEANVVERLVIEAERHVAVFDKLVEGEHGVVRLHHNFGDLRREKIS